jgi:hypothetical protein
MSSYHRATMADREKPVTVALLLKETPALAASPGLAEAATKTFDYAQFLLDKDENLTRTGALSGAARDLLRARIVELLGAGDLDDGEP